MDMSQAARAEAAAADGEASEGTVLVIQDCALRTIIGVHGDERRTSSTLRMDLEVELAPTRAGSTDALADTVDYAAVVSDVRAYVAMQECHLLERLAELVAARLIERFHARRVSLQLLKRGILDEVGAVGVRIQRRAPLLEAVTSIPGGRHGIHGS